MQTKLKDFQDSAGDATEGIQKGFDKVNKIIAASAIAIGLAVVGVGAKAVSFSDDLQKSLNGLQTATGTSDAAMGGLKDSLLNIYNNNFGESFEDIGAAMTTVAQGTGLTGKALETATQNALLLRDTFGFEVESSVKGADALMKQFGLTSDQSFNLMAQGAQNGLDKNGDLLDTLNEYSGTFAAQGFSATEMFNMLSNASKSGIRDVDLAADAIKEFGIRSKDGSDATAEGFAALGLNAGEMTKAFAKGGETGQKAFQTVTEKLIGMKDPVAQTAAGVALFGTQFEDLGIKGITALSNTKGGIDSTKDSLTAINAIKYNSFGEGLSGIGRIIMTSVFIPIGEKLIPKLQEFSEFIMANMPAIKAKIADAMNSVGPIIDNVVAAIKVFITVFTKVVGFIVDHQVAFTNIAIVLGSVIIAFNLVAAVLGIVTAATTLFGIVLAFVTSPIGLVVLAIAAVIAIGVLLWKNWDKVKEVTIAVWNGIVAFFGVVFDVIKAIFIFYVAAWTLIIKTAFNVIKTVITVIINVVKAVITTVFNVIKGIFTLYVNAWKFIITTVFNAIKFVITNVVGGIKLVITTVFNTIKSTITTVVNGIKTTVTNVWNGIKSTTVSVFNGVKNAVMTPINAMRDGVKAGIDKIKGFFTGMKLSFPKIKMPHFSLSGSFSLAKMTVPKLGVDWYQKGGEFNKASVIGIAENGAEAVVPLEKNTGWADKVANLLSDRMSQGGGGLNVTITNFVNNRSQDIQALAEELEFYRKRQSLGRG